MSGKYYSSEDDSEDFSDNFSLGNYINPKNFSSKKSKRTSRKKSRRTSRKKSRRTSRKKSRRTSRKKSRKTSRRRRSSKPCKSYQHRDPVTHRCKNKPCKSYQRRDPITHRCKNKPCKQDKHRDSVSKRCVKKNSSRKTSRKKSRKTSRRRRSRRTSRRRRSSTRKPYKPCKSHQYRDPVTHRCRNKSYKPCKSHQYRDHVTHRCRNKSGRKTPGKKPKKTSDKKPKSKVTYNCLTNKTTRQPYCQRITGGTGKYKTLQDCLAVCKRVTGGYDYNGGACQWNINGKYKTLDECKKETDKNCKSKYGCSDSETWKKCYRRNSLRLHPDKGGDPEKFKELVNCNDFFTK